MSRIDCVVSSSVIDPLALATVADLPPVTPDALVVFGIVLLALVLFVTELVRIGVDPFPFVLAVTFAASTAFLTPVGYQTNLFVYGPGGYRFSDYIRIGAPLQLFLSVVTVAGIVVLWGL